MSEQPPTTPESPQARPGPKPTAVAQLPTEPVPPATPTSGPQANSAAVHQLEPSVSAVRRLTIWFLIPAALVLIADLASKAWYFRGGIEHAELRYSAVDWIQIHVNTGVAWSLFADYPVAVVLMTVVLIPVLGLVYWRFFSGQSRWVDVAFGSILGGAFGNAYDRVSGLFPQWGVGGVRDFISVDLGVWPANPWPTFNIADAGITIGFILLILCQRSPPADDADGDTSSQNPQPQGQQ